MYPCLRQAWTGSHQRVWARTELKAFKVLPVSAHLLRDDGARLGLKERRQRDRFWFTT